MWFELWLKALKLKFESAGIKKIMIERVLIFQKFVYFDKIYHS